MDFFNTKKKYKTIKEINKKLHDSRSRRTNNICCKRHSRVTPFAPFLGLFKYFLLAYDEIG